MIVLKPGVSKVSVDDLTFSPSGSILAAPAGAKGIMLWAEFAANEKSKVVTLPDGDLANRIAFTPRGNTIFAGSQKLYALDLSSHTATCVPVDRSNTSDQLHPRVPISFGVSRDGTALLMAEIQAGRVFTRLTCWPSDNFTKHYWQLDIPAKVDLPFLFPPTPDTFIHLGPTHLSHTPGWGATTRSISTGAEIFQHQPLWICPTQGVLSSEGHILAARFRGELILYVHESKWNYVKKIQNDGRSYFTGLAFHPSGRYLAATSNDQTVKLYDTTTWAVTKTYTWDVGRMRSVAFSPDGTLAAAGSDTGKVVVWDVDV